MKKVLFVAAAASSLLIYSCGNEGNNQLTQEQIDSIAQAKADSITLENKRIADSIIAADSIRIADSIAAAAAAKTSTGTTTTKKPATSKPATNNKPEPTPAPEPAKPTNPKSDRFTGENSGTSNKGSRFDNDAKAAEAQKNTENKASRFNNR